MATLKPVSDGTRRRQGSFSVRDARKTDQYVSPNMNAEWVNDKGAWLIHLIVIGAVKIMLDTIPGMSQQTTWMLTNVLYSFGSYLMFHFYNGTPFDFNSGACDKLSMWEQIDHGAQYTPARKFLVAVPIGLFLVSTHYANYDLFYFLLSLGAAVAAVIPKLPNAHGFSFGSSETL